MSYVVSLSLIVSSPLARPWGVMDSILSMLSLSRYTTVGVRASAVSHSAISLAGCCTCAGASPGCNFISSVEPPWAPEISTEPAAKCSDFLADYSFEPTSASCCYAASSFLSILTSLTFASSVSTNSCSAWLICLLASLINSTVELLYYFISCYLPFSAACSCDGSCCCMFSSTCRAFPWRTGSSIECGSFLMAESGSSLFDFSIWVSFCGWLI